MQPHVKLNSVSAGELAISSVALASDAPSTQRVHLSNSTAYRLDESMVLRAAFETVEQPVFVVDTREDCILDANPAACQILSIEHDRLIGRSWSRIAGFLIGVTYREVGNFRLVATAQNPPSSLAERWAAPRDALTGLLTREALLLHFSAGCRSGVLFIDLDKFKGINDSFGHLAGDRVLQITSARLADCVRPTDVVVRFGGDEFLVLVKGMNRRRDLTRLARRIARQVRTPIEFQGQSLRVSASIGIGRSKSGTSTMDELISAADRGMYRAKLRKSGFFADETMSNR